MKIFLCHASEDKPRAEIIYYALNANHEVFFDQESLSASEDYHTSIRKQISETDLFIFLISPNSLKERKYTLAELKIAMNKWPHPKNAVLPVLIEDISFSEIPAYLKAVTVLQPKGEIGAEVAFAVDQMVELRNREARVKKDSARFNEVLIRRLMVAMGDLGFSPNLEKWLKNVEKEDPNWEIRNKYSSTAKVFITKTFVGVLGIQLEKLMAIGMEESSKEKEKKYLEYCTLTAQRALQLICFAFLSSLWDIQEQNHKPIPPGPKEKIRNFFEGTTELDIKDYLFLLQSLIEVFQENGWKFPLEEMETFLPKLASDHSFSTSCLTLSQIQADLDANTIGLLDCLSAEENLAEMLVHLAFLATYKMVSIKNISYEELRNRSPRFLHKYASLGVTGKSEYNSEKLSFWDWTVRTEGILLYKNDYKDNLDLFPFIIDYNGLIDEGNSRICFFIANDVLDKKRTYRFLRDNKNQTIALSESGKKAKNLEELLEDPEDPKSVKIDMAYLQFEEAKNAILGTSSEKVDDFNSLLDV